MVISLLRRGQRRSLVMVLAALVGTMLAVVGPTAVAEAGAPGQNPVSCTPAATWRYQDFNVAGRVIRQELRHSYACGTVGWSRLTNISGSAPALVLEQFAWNPGQPSSRGVPGTNYTYTVDARPGRQVCGGFHAWWVDNQGVWHYINWFFAGCYWG